MKSTMKGDDNGASKQGKVQLKSFPCVALLFVLASCSERAGETALPQRSGRAAEPAPIVDMSPPSVEEIVSANDCVPPPCDDIGACMRAPMTDVRGLQCQLAEGGREARCEFAARLDMSGGEDGRHFSLRLRRLESQDWCIDQRISGGK